MRTKTVDRLVWMTTVMLALAAVGCGGTNVFDSGPGAGRVVEADRETFSLDGRSAKRLVANTTNGAIELSAGSTEDVVVTVTREVRADDRSVARDYIGRVSVLAERRGDDVVIESTIPDSPRGVDVNVSYAIEAPAQMMAVLTTVNGVMEVSGMEEAVVARGHNAMIAVRDVDGAVEATTVNGVITAEIDVLTGSAVFRTTNGNVDVVVRSGGSDVSATTTNGNVAVALPDTFSGKVDLRTMNGSATTGFDVRSAGGQTRNRIRGEIGMGGVDREVRLRSTNGDVRLVRDGG